MVTISVELGVDQIVRAIQQLSADRQKEVLVALEDLFFGFLIAETENDEMLSREAAMVYVEQIEAQGVP